MARVRFNVAIDMENLDFSDFTDGDIDSFSSTELTLSSGDFAATLTGENFSPFGPSGTVFTFTTFFQDQAQIEITRLNLDVGEVYENRDDTAAIAGLLFGGRDTFIGSNGVDVLLSGAGADTLDGNRGGDLLFGGSGRDTFVYNSVLDSSRRNPDTIGDLSNADTINLRDLGISLEDILLGYNSVTNITTILINTDADAAAEMRILAVGDHTDFDGFIVA